MIINISNRGAAGELNCQQMLSAVLFITCLAAKALYYYTLMQCQAATGAYNEQTNCSGAAHTEAIWTHSPNHKLGPCIYKDVASKLFAFQQHSRV